MSVWLFLVPAFALIIIWLYVYNRKRSALLREFGAKHGMGYKRTDPELEKVLNTVFALQAPCLRTFSRPRDVVSRGDTAMFRITELIDLSRYGQAQNTHHGHIALLTTLSTKDELFAWFHPGGTYRSPIRDVEGLESNPVLPQMNHILEQDPPPHVLSVTISQGHVLMYFLPALVGAVNAKDLEKLSNYGQRIKELF